MEWHILKIHNSVIIFLSILLFFTGCEPNTIGLESITSDDVIREEESYDTIPFTVIADTRSLELLQEDTITVLITSEVNDWDYSVETVSGKISNILPASFDYTRSINDTQETQKDEITIKFMDKENGRNYEYVIPLLFKKIPEILE